MEQFANGYLRLPYPKSRDTIASKKNIPLTQTLQKDSKSMTKFSSSVRTNTSQIFLYPSKILLIIFLDGRLFIRISKIFVWCYLNSQNESVVHSSCWNRCWLRVFWLLAGLEARWSSARGLWVNDGCQLLVMKYQFP